MAKKEPRPRAPEGRALRLEDLDPEGRQAAEENWRHMGMVATNMAGSIEQARQAVENVSNKPQYREGAKKRLTSMEAVAPHVKDIPMTTEGAQGVRVQRVHEARQRAQEEGEEVPRGTGWYFTHHARIAAVARKHGIDTQKAITATTNMSPMNNPETELKAGGALMDMVANQRKHTVHITPEIHAASAASVKRNGGPPMPKSWIGKNVRLSDMHAAHIAGVASIAADQRNQGTPIQSTANFEDVGAARGAANATASIEHLRGDRSREETIDPHSSPKVWSYEKSTSESVPGSETHLEYMARARDFQRRGTAGVRGGQRTPRGFRSETEEQRTQRRTEAAGAALGAAAATPGSEEHRAATMRMGLTGIEQSKRTGRHTLPDIRPQRRSQEGVLSSQADTAEDTWMHSMSTQQPPTSIKTGESAKSGTSIAKTVASEGPAGEKHMRKKSPISEATVVNDPRIKNASLNHALNNYATRGAAEELGLPATMTQEVPWTEQRIQANKDPDYAREMRTRQTGNRSLPKQASPLGRQYPQAERNPVVPIDHAAAKSLYDRVTGGGPAATPKEISHVERLRTQRKKGA